MLFNSFQFALFFLVVLGLYWGAPKAKRHAVLFGASLLFYGLWIPSYLVLLLTTLVVNYLLLRGMQGSERKGIYVACACVFTLSLLAYFKYAAMLVETIGPFFVRGWGWEPQLPAVLLPLGISFYSFQILALTIDSYRGQLDEVPSFFRYALYI